MATKGTLRRLFVSYSFSKTLTNVPMCGRISTANSSLCRSVTLGLLPTPTPAGVPVIMTVPAGRVVPCDKKLTSLEIPKMRSLFVSCQLLMRRDTLRWWWSLLCAAILHHLAILETSYRQL